VSNFDDMRRQHQLEAPHVVRQQGDWMTLEDAREFAAKAPTRFTVYRLPAWPPGVWSAIPRTLKELPTEAEVDEPPQPKQEGSLF